MKQDAIAAVFVFLAGCAPLVFIVWRSVTRKNVRDRRREAMTACLAQASEYASLRPPLVDLAAGKALLLLPDDRGIALFQVSSNPKVIGPGQIVSCEVLVNGVSAKEAGVLQHAAASAVVGGVLMGGVGAALGALNSQGSLKLRIIVDSTESPIDEFEVRGENLRGHRPAASHESLFELQTIIEVMVRRAEKGLGGLSVQ